MRGPSQRSAALVACSPRPARWIRRIPGATTLSFPRSNRSAPRLSAKKSRPRPRTIAPSRSSAATPSVSRRYSRAIARACGSSRGGSGTRFGARRVRATRVEFGSLRSRATKNPHEPKWCGKIRRARSTVGRNETPFHDVTPGSPGTSAGSGAISTSSRAASAAVSTASFSSGA